MAEIFQDQSNRCWNERFLPEDETITTNGLDSFMGLCAGLTVLLIILYRLY